MIDNPRFDVGQLVQTTEGCSHLILEREYSGHHYDKDWHYTILMSSSRGIMIDMLSEYELRLALIKN